MSDVVLKVVNGWAIHPSSLKTAAGTPRFTVHFPTHLHGDQGTRHLIVNDAQTGYEVPTRDLLESVLRPGDLFLDVGAHWGFFSLQAATHPAGAVNVIAVEADAQNAAILFRNISANGLTEAIQPVCAACGDRAELAPLISNTNMGHSVRGTGLKPPFGRGPAKWVPVLTLDQILAAVPHSSDSRVILKIDVEGFEPQVLAGAQELLASGRVALIIWERGHAFADGVERDLMLAMVDRLSRIGYRHWRPAHKHRPTPLIPFHPEEKYQCNVFSAATGVEIPGVEGGV